MNNNFDTIFYKPFVKYDDLPVESADYNVQFVDSAAFGSRDNIDVLSNNLNTIYNTMLELDKETSKCVDVIIQRGTMMKLQLKISELAANNPAIAQASKTLFGKIVETIDITKLVELLNYQNDLLMEHASDVVNDNRTTIDNSLSTQLNAVGLIKQQFYIMALNSEAEFVLLLDTALSVQSQSNGLQSMAVQMGTTLDGGNLTLKKPPVKQDKTVVNAENRDVTQEPLPIKPAGNSIEPKVDDLWEQIKKECIPCLDQSLYGFNNFSWSGTNSEWAKLQNKYDQMITLMKEGLISMINRVDELKTLLLPNAGLQPELCNLLSLLFNRVCLPDIAAMAMQFKLLMGKFKLDMEKWCWGSVSWSDIFMQPIAQFILTELNKLWQLILAPTQCVLTSIDHEARKLFIDSNLQSFITDMYSYQTTINQWILSQADVVRNFFTFQIGSDSQMFDLIREIQKLRVYTGFMMNLYELYKGFEALNVKDLLDPAGRKKIFEELCIKSHGLSLTWLDKELDAFKNSARDLVLGNSDTNKQAEENFGILNKDGILVPPGFKFDTNDNMFSIISDPTIPLDFLDGIDADEVYTNPKYYSLFNDVLERKPTLEEGSNPFTFNPVILAKLRKFKEQIKNSTDLMIINNRQLTSMPVLLIDRQRCLQINNLAGYTPEQVNSWMNKILS